MIEERRHVSYVRVCRLRQNSISHVEPHGLEVGLPNKKEVRVRRHIVTVGVPDDLCGLFCDVETLSIHTKNVSERLVERVRRVVVVFARETKRTEAGCGRINPRGHVKTQGRLTGGRCRRGRIRICDDELKA